VKAERVVAGGVCLPAEADDCEAVAKEPGIAAIVLYVPVAAIDEGDDAAATAVWIFEKQRAVATMRIFGPDGDEVGGELDFAVA